MLLRPHPHWKQHGRCDVHRNKLEPGPNCARHMLLSMQCVQDCCYKEMHVLICFASRIALSVDGSLVCGLELSQSHFMFYLPPVTHPGDTPVQAAEPADRRRGPCGAAEKHSLHPARQDEPDATENSAASRVRRRPGGLHPVRGICLAHIS